MRILLAEDERDLNRIITKKLVSSGYSVDSCYDGNEAMDHLACAEYDAIILDIMMPGTVTVESEPEHGSTFTVSFPLQ